MKRYILAAAAMFCLSFSFTGTHTSSARAQETVSSSLVGEDGKPFGDTISIQPSAPSSWLDQWLERAFKAIATAAATALVAWLTMMARKNGVELTAGQQQMLKDFAIQAISYAEEYAANYLKQTGKKLSSDGKLTAALDFLKRKAAEAKIPVGDKTAHDAVHAALPFSPFGAVSIDGLSGK